MILLIECRGKQEFGSVHIQTQMETVPIWVNRLIWVQARKELKYVFKNETDYI